MHCENNNLVEICPFHQLWLIWFGEHQQAPVIYGVFTAKGYRIHPELFGPRPKEVLIPLCATPPPQHHHHHRALSAPWSSCRTVSLVPSSARCSGSPHMLLSGVDGSCREPGHFEGGGGLCLSNVTPHQVLVAPPTLK